MPINAMFGYPPDMDLIMTEDRSTNGSAVRTLTIETRIPFPDTAAGVAAWEGVREAIRHIDSVAGRRAAYEMVYRHGQNDLDRPGPAHAVLQATFGQIQVDGDAIPR